MLGLFNSKPVVLVLCCSGVGELQIWTARRLLS